MGLSGGEVVGGDAFRASKKAALLLTELGLDWRLSAGSRSPVTALVLQLLPDCWRSDTEVATSDAEVI